MPAAFSTSATRRRSRPSHAAADPTLRVRRGNPVLRHPRRARCARAEGRVPRGRRAAARSGPHRRRPRAARQGTHRRQIRARVRDRCAAAAGSAARDALIGFCGAPWTVATYMAGEQGRATRPRRGYGPIAIAARSRADRAARRGLGRLPRRQVAAGADALQIFDSWAGSLPDTEFEAWVVAPTRTMVAQLKARCPGCRSSASRGAPGARGLLCARDGRRCDRLRYHDAARRDGGARRRRRRGPGQSRPAAARRGRRGLEQKVEQILEAMRGKPFIFNLGHGIVPETPPEHVARLVELVRRERGAPA